MISDQWYLLIKFSAICSGTIEQHTSIVVRLSSIGNFLDFPDVANSGFISYILR